MRAILVDDEQLALDFLEQLIEDVSTVEVVAKYLSLEKDQLKSALIDIDVAFLDVEMPYMDGLELAELMMSINPQIHIVFVTAFSQYAVEAFELNAIDFIVKPVDKRRLKQTIDRIESAMSKQIKELTPSKQSLYIQLCNEFSIIIDEQTSEHIKWRTSRAKEVFLYLLHHRGEIVRKSTLIDIIWDNFDSDRAYPQLYTTVYHIRNALKSFENHLFIQSMMDGYVLHTKNVHIDIEKWKKRINSLSSITKKTIDGYEEAMVYYKGSYLGNENYLWLVPEQYKLEALWIETAHKIARFYLDSQYLDKAEEWYRKISEQFPEDEQAQFSLMKIYHQFNYHLLIEQQYLQLKSTLENLDTAMNLEIEVWYHKIMDPSSR